MRVLDAYYKTPKKTLASQKREQWVKPVMLRLVRTGEGTKDTRQRQRKSDLLEMAKDAVEREAIEAVIQSLVDGRLLVSDRIDNQDVIDLSHEALMRSWKRLVTWREGDREVRRIVDAIEDARRVWTDKGKKRRDLLEGRLLKDGKRLLKDAPEEAVSVENFIQRSWRLTVLKFLLDPGIFIFGIVLMSMYDSRQKEIEYSYKEIEQYKNGGQNERNAVRNLVQGCYQLKMDGEIPRDSRGLLNTFHMRSFRESIFGNCRLLKDVRLEKADLGDLSLNGADLQGANLNSGYLKAAQLIGVNLQNTDLSGANLISANLTIANLRSAQLSGTDFTKANLTSANLSGSRFECLGDKKTISKKVRQCPNIKDITWDRETNWQGIQGWETVENIPPALKQQLGLK